MLDELIRFVPPLLLAGLLSWFLTGVVRRFACRRGLVTKPRERDSHTKPIPRLGGVALIFSFIITIVLTELLTPNVLWFTTELRLSLDRHVLGIILGCLILLVFGIVDDLKGLKPWQQLVGQALAAVAIIFAGIGITSLTNPFGGVIDLTHPSWLLFHAGQYTVTLKLWSDLLTVVWLILVMNVMNWFDGLDGMAGGVSVIAAFMLALLSIMVGSPTGTVALLLVFAGSVIGFLGWNWHPARIFMGTSGSTFLGFILGISAIITGGKLATTFLVLGVPILDALWVIVKRLRSGQSAWLADRNHLHHRLLAAGFSVQQTVLLMYLAAAGFGVVALLRNSTGAKLLLFCGLVLCMILIDRWLQRVVKKSS